MQGFGQQAFLMINRVKVMNDNENIYVEYYFNTEIIKSVEVLESGNG